MMARSSERPGRGSRRGFTLVELMVALALGAVLIGLLAGLGSLQGRPARRAAERLAHVSALRAVYARLAQDLPLARAQPEVSADGRALSFLLRAPGAPARRVVYAAGIDGTTTRRVLPASGAGADLEPPHRIRTEAPVEVRFQVRGAPEELVLDLSARTPPRPGETPDPREQVLIEMRLPDFALDEARMLPYWSSPRPQG